MVRHNVPIKLLVAGSIVSSIAEFVVLLALSLDSSLLEMLCGSEGSAQSPAALCRAFLASRGHFLDNSPQAAVCIVLVSPRSQSSISFQLHGFVSTQMCTFLPLLLSERTRRALILEAVHGSNIHSGRARKYHALSPYVAIQLIAGTLTETASLFFAIMEADRGPIFSVWFGLLCGGT